MGRMEATMLRTPVVKNRDPGYSPNLIASHQHWIQFLSHTEFSITTLNLSLLVCFGRISGHVEHIPVPSLQKVPQTKEISKPPIDGLEKSYGPEAGKGGVSTLL